MPTDRSGLRTERPSGPVRTCVGCRRTDSWSVLLRVVARSGEGGRVVLVPDPGHRRGGRGAWLHPHLDCLEQAIRRRAFGRALRVQSQPDPGQVWAYVEALA